MVLLNIHPLLHEKKIRIDEKGEEWGERVSENDTNQDRKKFRRRRYLILTRKKKRSKNALKSKAQTKLCDK